MGKYTLYIDELDPSPFFNPFQFAVFTTAIIAHTILLRLLYSISLEFLHEKAYYWDYAQHLDIRYLDHPPMVGWVIWVFTTALGQSDFKRILEQLFIRFLHLFR